MANDALLELFHKVASLEKRVAGMIRHATVEEVNAAEGWVRMNLGPGDAGPLLSAKMPYAQLAGAMKVHTPPSEKQNMTIIAPGGDLRQAVALPMTWSDANQSPSDKGDEHVLKFGQVTIKIEADKVTLSIGGFSFTVSPDDAVFKIGGVKHRISGEGLKTDGGDVVHNDKSIGSGHGHTEIKRGGEVSGPPVGKDG